MSANRNAIPTDKESVRSAGAGSADQKLKAAQRDAHTRQRPQTPEVQATSQSQMENGAAEAELRRRETIARSLEEPSSRGDLYRLFTHLEAHIQEIAQYLQLPHRTKTQESQSGNQQGPQLGHPSIYQQVSQSQPQVQPQPLVRPPAQYFSGPQPSIQHPSVDSSCQQLQLQLQLQMLSQMQFQIQQNQTQLAQRNSSSFQFDHTAECLHCLHGRDQFPQYQNQIEAPLLPPISNIATQNDTQRANGNEIRQATAITKEQIRNGELTDFELVQRCPAIPIPNTEFQLRTVTLVEPAHINPEKCAQIRPANSKKHQVMDNFPIRNLNQIRRSSSGRRPNPADENNAVHPTKKGLGSLAPVPGTEGWGPI